MRKLKVGDEVVIPDSGLFSNAYEAVVTDVPVDYDLIYMVKVKPLHGFFRYEHWVRSYQIYGILADKV